MTESSSFYSNMNNNNNVHRRSLSKYDSHTKSQRHQQFIRHSQLHRKYSLSSFEDKVSSLSEEDGSLLYDSENIPPNISHNVVINRSSPFSSSKVKEIQPEINNNNNNNNNMLRSPIMKHHNERQSPAVSSASSLSFSSEPRSILFYNQILFQNIIFIYSDY